MAVVPGPAPSTVVIDYAHTPDALAKVLPALTPGPGGRKICLFGCGGDRDRTKRPVMGEIAGALADLAVVTSDNPRSEDPEAIIADILTGMTPDPERVHVEPDRACAIGWALAQGQPGDVIVLAGKGHETYQEIRGVQYPMDEREIVKKWFETAPGRQERTGNIPAGIV